MSAFSVWVLTIVGVVLLGMLVDTVLPDGQTNKYIKSIFAILTVFVISAPLPKLLSADMQLENMFGDSASHSIDNEFVQSIYMQKNAQNLQLAKNELERQGICGVDIVATYSQKNGVMVYTFCFVDISNVVVNNGVTNVNGKIRDLLSNIFNLDKESITIYG